MACRISGILTCILLLQPMLIPTPCPARLLGLTPLPEGRARGVVWGGILGTAGRRLFSSVARRWPREVGGEFTVTVTVTAPHLARLGLLEGALVLWAVVLWAGRWMEEG